MLSKHNYVMRQVYNKFTFLSQGDYVLHLLWLLQYDSSKMFYFSNSVPAHHRTFCARYQFILALYHMEVGYNVVEGKVLNDDT